MSELGGESGLLTTMASEAQRPHQHTPPTSSQCNHLYTCQPLVVFLTFNHQFMAPGRHVRQCQHLIIPSSPLSLSSSADLPSRTCPAIRRRAKYLLVKGRESEGTESPVQELTDEDGIGKGSCSDLRLMSLPHVHRTPIYLF